MAWIVRVLVSTNETILMATFIGSVMGIFKSDKAFAHPQWQWYSVYVHPVR